MARRPHRMTARRRTALRKAQLASARKRKRNRRIAAGVAVGVLGATLAYRKYDSKVEYQQRRYLSIKAHNALYAANIHGGDGDEYWHKNYDAVRQPARYRKRPAAIQTKMAIGAQRKKVLGKRLGGAVNIAERAITTPAPGKVFLLRRSTPYADFKPKFKTNLKRRNIVGTKTIQVHQRIGKHTYTLGASRKVRR